MILLESGIVDSELNTDTAAPRVDDVDAPLSTEAAALNADAAMVVVGDVVCVEMSIVKVALVAIVTIESAECRREW
jgi:hypothetical protein